jgi:hypothetical protein
MRTCSKCHKRLHKTEFFMRSVIKSLYHSQCKGCYKHQRENSYPKHYKARGEAYRKRALSSQARKRAEFHTRMLEVLRSQACSRCGEDDIRVLEFDHVDKSEKSFSISQSIRLNKSWDETVSEMQKCQILCANCHKKRTAVQFNWYKS